MLTGTIRSWYLLDTCNEACLNLVTKPEELRKDEGGDLDLVCTYVCINQLSYPIVIMQQLETQHNEVWRMLASLFVFQI